MMMDYTGEFDADIAMSLAARAYSIAKDLTEAAKTRPGITTDELTSLQKQSNEFEALLGTLYTAGDEQIAAAITMCSRFINREHDIKAGEV